MAKPLTTEQINALTLATKNVDRLTRLQVFTLATSGLIDVVDGEFVVTKKGANKLRRHTRKAQVQNAVPVVMEAALAILDTQDRVCNHREIWERVGRDKFDRQVVLDALRVLREEAVLETFSLGGSNNPFQIRWRRGAAAPPVAAPPAVVEAAEGEVTEA